MDNLVEYTRENQIGTLNLKNGKNNPLNLTILTSIYSKITLSSNNRDRILIIRSDGVNFTVGVDFKYIYKTVIQDENYEDFAKLSQSFQDITKSILNHPGLVMVLMKGWVIGGGFEISLAADLRIAAKSTKIMLPELSIGTMFSNACTKLLPDLIGLSRAKEIMFLGDKLDAESAFNIGLVNKVVEDSELDQVSTDLSIEFCKNTYSIAFKEAKELILKNTNLSIPEVLENELNALNRLGKDPVFLENIRKFVEK